MDLTEELHQTGRVWLREFFSTAEVSELAAHCAFEERPGARLDLTDAISKFVGPMSRLASVVSGFGVDASPVRLVSFNKSDAANWSVPWHQDRVIAVASHHDVAGYSNWVSKSEFWHCEAPLSLLSDMVFVRVYIDEEQPENGPLQIALRSHKQGAISANKARVFAAACEIETCLGEPGDILVVHALTLHKSRSAEMVSTRRALRIDYAPRGSLDRNLEWAIPA